MNTKNYLSHVGNSVIKMHGFNAIKDFMFVSVTVTSDVIVFAAKERKENERCFKVSIDKSERTICDERFFNLIKERDLFNKRFIFSQPSDSYFSSDVSI